MSPRLHRTLQSSSKYYAASTELVSGEGSARLTGSHFVQLKPGSTNTGEIRMYAELGLGLMVMRVAISCALPPRDRTWSLTLQIRFVQYHGFAVINNRWTIYMMDIKKNEKFLKSVGPYSWSLPQDIGSDGRTGIQILNCCPPPTHTHTALQVTRLNLSLTPIFHLLTYCDSGLNK